MPENSIYSAEIWRALFFIMSASVVGLSIVFSKLILKIIESYKNTLDEKIEELCNDMKEVKEKTHSVDEFIKVFNKITNFDKIFKNIINKGKEGDNYE